MLKTNAFYFFLFSSLRFTPWSIVRLEFKQSPGFTAVANLTAGDKPCHSLCQFLAQIALKTKGFLRYLLRSDVFTSKMPLRCSKIYSCMIFFKLSGCISHFCEYLIGGFLVKTSLQLTFAIKLSRLKKVIFGTNFLFLNQEFFPH